MQTWSRFWNNGSCEKHDCSAPCVICLHEHDEGVQSRITPRDRLIAEGEKVRVLSLTNNDEFEIDLEDWVSEGII